MKLAILHLSDIHFRSVGNSVSSRVEKIAAACQKTTVDVSALLVLITGDIAFSGTPEEYSIATDFFQSLKAAFDKQNALCRTEFVFIPGNHDCDFRNQDDVRAALADAVLSNLDKIDLNSGVVTQLLAAQDSFFQFESRFRGSSPLTGHQRLRFKREFAFNGTHVSVNCYNTAWLSRKSEIAGKLAIPVNLLASQGSSSSQLEISIFHHRDNWLEPLNGRTFRSVLEKSSDVILTGHEHESSMYQKLLVSEASNSQYIEGGCLQESGTAESAFNLVFVDFEEKAQSVFKFVWKGDLYTSGGNEQSLPFVRNARLLRLQFQNNDEYLKVLDGPGTGFFHSGNPNLKLHEFFVYPDLRRRSLDTLIKKSKPLLPVDGENVLDFVLDRKCVLLIGQDDAGKSTLGKKLYKDLQSSHQLIPVLISGKELKEGNPRRSLERAIEKAVEQQYSKESIEPFWQLEKSKRVLIIDDWHQTSFNRKGQSAVVDSILQSFEYCVVFVGDFFMMQDLAQHSDGNPFSAFEYCDIKELGHERRNKLITRWHLIGAEFTLDDDRHLRQVSESEKIVNTLIGKNLLPSFPVTILTILQAQQATQKGSSSSTGSYGQLYELLITTALFSVSKKAADLGTMYTYLSWIAYELFQKDKADLTDDQMHKVHDEYRKVIKVPLIAEEIWAQLETSHILTKRNGYYSFKYKYIYCYFVAKYFQDNLANQNKQEKLRPVLKDIADKIYYEDYSNIIIFYVYLTKDHELIEHLLANAALIYAECKPCDFEGDVEFVNNLITSHNDLILPASSIVANRSAAKKQQDRADETDSNFIDQQKESKLCYANELNDLVKMHIALKSLRILGQVLRNFPGVFEGDFKLRLATESYQLGLRTLNAILELAQRDIENLRKYYGKLIQEQRALNVDDPSLAKDTDELIVWLTRRLAFGFVKRISYSVGLPELVETYQDVLESQGRTTAVRLVDTTIKLDHFSDFPESEIEELWKTVEGNFFSQSILRDLVADHFYLFPTEFRLRQKIGNLLKIRTEQYSVLQRKKHKALAAKTHKK